MSYDTYYNRGDSFWADEQADESAELQAEIEIENARVKRLERELASLQSNDPDALTAQLARDLGEDVATVRAKVQAVKAAGQAPTAPDPDKLSKLLDQVPDNDFEGAARAFSQAGYVTEDALGQQWQGGRIQRAGEPKGAPEEIYAFLDTATSFEDFEAKLRQVGLTERSA